MWLWGTSSRLKAFGCQESDSVFKRWGINTRSYLFTNTMATYFVRCTLHILTWKNDKSQSKTSYHKKWIGFNPGNESEGISLSNWDFSFFLSLSLEYISSLIWFASHKFTFHTCRSPLNLVEICVFEDTYIRLSGWVWSWGLPVGQGVKLESSENKSLSRNKQIVYFR